MWWRLSAGECHHRHVRTHTVLAVVKYLLWHQLRTPHYLGLYRTLKNDAYRIIVPLLEFKDPFGGFLPFK